MQSMVEGALRKRCACRRAPSVSRLRRLPPPRPGEEKQLSYRGLPVLTCPDGRHGHLALDPRRLWQSDAFRGQGDTLAAARRRFYAQGDSSDSKATLGNAKSDERGSFHPGHCQMCQPRGDLRPMVTANIGNIRGERRAWRPESAALSPPAGRSDSFPRARRPRPPAKGPTRTGPVLPAPLRPWRCPRAG